MRKTLDRELLLTIRDEALALLRPELLSKYRELSTPPFLVPVRYGEGSDGTHEFWALARRGPTLLLYDDIEEYFSTGVLDEDGVLRKWDNLEPQDRLEGALKDLLSKGAS